MQTSKLTATTAVPAATPVLATKAVSMEFAESGAAAVQLVPQPQGVELEETACVFHQTEEIGAQMRVPHVVVLSVLFPQTVQEGISAIPTIAVALVFARS